jgi:hypothetical protein
MQHFARRAVTPAAKQVAKILLPTATISTLAYNSPQFSTWATSHFTAHARGLSSTSAWLPHPDLPAPTTMKEAISYNDYPPGYTDPLPDYSTLPDHGVKIVVASNFEEHILDPTKDVFVQFSQKNCSSCQSFQRITDAMAFAFREVPTVQFLEIVGTSNYIPGILTSQEEVLFPTFKFFPAGTAKQAQMNRAKDFVKMVREYNLKLGKDYNGDDPIPPGLEPQLAKSKFEGVGYSMPMTAGDDDQYVWETFIDHMWEQSRLKFDRDSVKKQIEIIEPALKREISHAIRGNLPGYELIGSLSPCGAQWDGFQETMLRRGVGSTKVSEFYEAMADLRKCISHNYSIENEFWKDMMNQSIHMSKTLDVVKHAKMHEGLTANQAHEFFSQYNQIKMKQQIDTLNAQDQDSRGGLGGYIPRSE